MIRLRHATICPDRQEDVIETAHGFTLLHCPSCDRYGATDPDTADGIRHRSSCERPGARTMLGFQRGDLLLRCPECGKFEALGTPASIRHATEPEPPAPEPETKPSKPRSRYVCRAHYSPVTWRGDGCRECAAEKKARRTSTPKPDKWAHLDQITTLIGANQ